MNPLEGVLVLDFSTLLPGPLATLWMAEAGARVIKIERPPHGDEMRSYVPRFGDTSVNFALLNAGKESMALDLRNEDDRARLMPLIREADILVEQFRPGVMARLGLDYETLKVINSRLIYCSITGYGQRGQKAGIAAHDLNYVADAGVLSLVQPQLPPVLLADIGGGSYPAMLNVLLALLRRGQTGEGAWLDIAMADNIFPWLYWGLGNGFGAGSWPTPGGDLVTGGSPRYGLYQTADGQFLAAAPLEDRFWRRFCELLGLSASDLDDGGDPEGTREQITQRIAAAPASHWQAVFKGEDVCCNFVRTLEEAVTDAHFQSRGLFSRTVRISDRSMPALPSPVAESLRIAADGLSPPALDSVHNTQ